MVRNRQHQEAKDRLSEIIERALKEGPQIITRHGVETAVVLSLADYKKLSLGHKRLVEFFQESPLAGVDLDLTRDTST